MKKLRLMRITTNSDNPNYLNYKKIIKNYLVQIKDRNIIIDEKIIRDNKFKMELFGYDKNKKMETSKFDETILKKIFNKIDKMPIRRMEILQRKYINLKNKVENNK